MSSIVFAPSLTWFVSLSVSLLPTNSDLLNTAWRQRRQKSAFQRRNYKSFDSDFALSNNPANGDDEEERTINRVSSLSVTLSL